MLDFGAVSLEWGPIWACSLALLILLIVAIAKKMSCSRQSEKTIESLERRIAALEKERDPSKS